MSKKPQYDPEEIRYPDQRIVESPLVPEMEKSYIEYAMSVIKSRALPDVRDGLKPVHRRILYAMYEDNLTSDKPFKKSATCVGDVLGRYHPHGDGSVYDALVRLAQDFSMRYPLVEGHGNFGSVDGDPPAAYRYTEARLSKLSNEILRDIEKETVDWDPNFDESRKEPRVLPSRFPNLLVNGSSGIAVGMATNIPPHNLGEVIDGCIAYIDNPDIDLDELSETLTRLKGIANRQIGVIELAHTLDIDEVTEIFIRINSKGTALSQSDFVMSKMAADTAHGGSLMRKAVDYFCHLAVRPEFYGNMIRDKEFGESKYAAKIGWLAKDNSDIYNPDYGDMLRVSFMHQFRRGKLADLVSLLSGRDFETKEFREDIIADSYDRMDKGILNFANEYNFNQFVLAIKGAGFVSHKLLNSAMTLDFAYTLYLILLDAPEIPNDQIKHYVQKWFVLSTLTSRYIGSPESQMDRDMRSIQEKGFLSFLADTEASALSETFWTVTLPQNLETSSVNSPAFNVFLAAQEHLNCNSLFMNGLKVGDLITISGDIHHIFPRAYLRDKGVNSKTKYNQVANYIYLDPQVNKAISDSAPCEYFGRALRQCETKELELGNITELTLLKENLAENCIPETVIEMDASRYDEFLIERRKLMAAMMRRYYMSL